MTLTLCLWDPGFGVRDLRGLHVPAHGSWHPKPVQRPESPTALSQVAGPYPCTIVLNR